MLDTALLFAQTVATAGIALWMFTGLWDNILHPQQNENYTAEVMEMRRIRDGYPEDFAAVAHRAITNRRTQVLAFRCVVIAEGLAFLLLATATLAFVAALAGLLSPDTARALGILGAAIFTSIWAGMLIVGNYFCYWLGHEGAQLTHFHMNLWGLATIILLSIG